MWASDILTLLSSNFSVPLDPCTLGWPSSKKGADHVSAGVSLMKASFAADRFQLKPFLRTCLLFGDHCNVMPWSELQFRYLQTSPMTAFRIGRRSLGVICTTR
jgi:hypothetical protein